MPRLSLGLGVSSSSKLPSAAAPSGIPVASTASVVIGNAGADNNGTYVRKVPQQQLLLSDGGPLYSNIAGTCYVLGAGNADGRILFSPDAQAWNGLGQFSSSVMGTPFGSWILGFVYFDLENYGDWGFLPIATNASTNTAYIPDTGWSPAITITAAAPSGIGFPATVTSSYYGQMARNSGTTGNRTNTIGFISNKWYYFDNTQYTEEGLPYGNGVNIGLTTGNVWFWEEWYWDSGSIEMSFTQPNSNPSTDYASFPTTGWVQIAGRPGTFTTP